jgi:hypothetical protein
MFWGVKQLNKKRKSTGSERTLWRSTDKEEEGDLPG